ncbi:hypothetical protein M407DRAFT_71964 [Tulasnella calospora MUT 4182]|uniref:Uracil catabolism protein 4 n=1 Tax=Tulasnella calospora MUT 4182 TaxID=1051891 RepID=A0A0C3L3I4_9AGAM|nr:hypothetical protein M407DRAFT_71964 [Tulasnella calospora MUT 4182]
MSLLTVDLASSAANQVKYLRSLPAIRERCTRVHNLAQRDKLEYFEYHAEKESEVIDFCSQIIQRDFGTDYSKIPPHSRWRHFDVGRPRVQPLIDSWKSSNPAPSDLEIAKRLIDLFLVSVLLDAGAGNQWKYTEQNGSASFTRSEGLAVASFDMFVNGFFSADAKDPFRVDAAALAKISTEKVSAAMQVTSANPMSGIEGRTGLLANLGQALQSTPEFFGDSARPGNMLDFLKTQSITTSSGKPKIHISALFTLLIEGLNSIWPPSRTQLDGVSLGDVWPCISLAASGNPKLKTKSHAAAGEDLVPFHKLTQWTTYSLVEPIEKVLGWEVEGMEDMTGLPEYRNGGLLVDFGVLTLRPGAVSSYRETPDSLPKLPPSHPAIIEWRAMTVIELDRIADGIRKKLNFPFTLAQVLESATWKGGREIAKQKRPETGGPPIEIESDGTVF